MRKVKLLLTVLAMFAATAISFAQTVEVSGSVVDENGAPLEGVTVLVQGTSQGASTNSGGHYSIRGVASNATLVFSSIGYADVTVPVNGRASIPTVTMREDAEALQETIVVAFGTSTKEAFTGSAAVVNSEKFEKSQVSSVTNALAGKVAGVQLTSSNGAPGSTSTIRIRGISSISAGNSPLIIVDGAPYGGDIATLNPSDIESMTVLKDAASNALYGARGANGVIMITTKSAKRGQAVVTFDAKVGVNSHAQRQYDVIKDPSNYYEYVYTAVDNYYQSLGLSPLESNARINANFLDYFSYPIYSVPTGENLFGSNGKLNPNATLGNIVNYNGEDYYIAPDDWSQYGYRKGIRQEYNVNVTGATDRSTFYASVGYLNNQGITENSDFKRLTTRLRADYQAKDWLKVGGNMAYAHFDSNFLSNNGSSTSTGNVWAFTSQIAPIYPLYIRNADGTPKIDANGYEIMDYGSGLNAGYGRSFLGDANPIMDNKLNTKNSEGNTMSASGFADFTILPGLKLTINGTTYLDETRYTYVYNPYYGQFDSTGGTVSKEHDRYITYNLQQLLNYNKKIDLHNFSALLGHEYYDAKSYGLWASKSNMFSQANKELSGAVVDGQSAGSSISEYNNEGYFTRLQYDYDSKIFVSASLRRDASSRFHPDHRWGTFWSLGAAYIISKEPWFQVPYVDELKLKMSYGSQGNDNISNYMYTDTFDIINSSGSVATSFSSKGNENITWETNGNFNTGVEFTMFNGRLYGGVEAFYRKTTDMLFSFPVAPSMGYSSYYANVGDMRNGGFEIELGGTIIQKKNFTWDANFNLTYVKNKILMLDEEKKTTTAYDTNLKEYKGYQSGSNFIAEGLSLNTWYLKDYAGIDPETGESLWYYNVTDAETGELTGERATTNEWDKGDYYVTDKVGMAPFYGGFSTSLQFYGFDFSIACSYQFGGQTYDGTYATFMTNPASSHLGYNIHKDALNAWSSTNTSSNIPRWQYNDIYSAASSTRFLISNRYLNIENINFGYTIPSKWLDQIKVASLRFYVSLDNLWYWSARKGLDPRQGYGSSNATNYSPMRTVSGGVTVKF